MVETAKNSMSLCVIVPAFNEELLIGKGIESLLRSGLSPPDIYVIDDGSIDRTSLIADSFGVNVIRNAANQGKAESIKRVIKRFEIQERYDYMALLDADTQVDKNYVRAIEKAFALNPSANIICGQPVSRPYNWLTSWRACSYFLGRYVFKGAQSKMRVIFVASGCASIYRTSIVDRIDWNSETLVEDMDVTIQAYRNKLGRVIYDRGIVTFTQDPRTLKEYIGQMNRWYKGTWNVAKKHRLPFGFQLIDLEFLFLLGEGLIVSLFVVSLPLWFLFSPKWTLMLLVWELATMGLIAVTGSIVERRLDMVKYFPVFWLLKILDAIILLHSFVFIILMRRSTAVWFKVGRYCYRENISTGGNNG